MLIKINKIGSCFENENNNNNFEILKVSLKILNDYYKKMAEDSCYYEYEEEKQALFNIVDLLYDIKLIK